MPAKVTLTVQGGALDGREYEFVRPTQCVVGRGDDCTVRLPNRGWEFAMVSRHHCQLDIDPPRVRVRDLGSRNGTYINGRLIGLRAAEESPESAADMVFCRYELQEGDILGIGPVHFRVSVSGVETVIAEGVMAAGEPLALGTALEQKER